MIEADDKASELIEAMGYGVTGHYTDLIAAALHDARRAGLREAIEILVRDSEKKTYRQRERFRIAACIALISIVIDKESSDG